MSVSVRVSNENCCAKGCNSLRSKSPNLHFHTLPRLNGQMVEVLNDFGVRESWDRRELWIHRLQIKTTKSMSVKVCSKHFVESDYLGPCDPSRRKNLKRNAVPSRNLPIQIALSQEEPKNSSNASSTKDFHPCNMCMVKLEERNPDDAEMQVEENNTETTTQDHTKSETVIKFENDGVALIKTERDDEDVMYVEPNPLKDDAVLSDENNAIHELSNAKVMIIDNNAVLIESENSGNTDKSVQVNFESFYERISTVAQLYTLTGVMNFKMLDKIVESVRESLPKKLSTTHNLSLEDRVMFCLVKSHLKLPIVAIAFFFNISPAAAGVIFKEYHKITKDCVNKITCVKTGRTN